MFSRSCLEEEMNNKLTIALLAKNETTLFKKALGSAGFADEIIVVLDDNGSVETKNIALKCKAKVYSNKFVNFASQKNYLLSKCTNDWVFLLDADEEISPSLANEIEKLLRITNNEVAYQVARKNIIFGKWVKHTGWFPDCQTRLFNKNKVRYEGLVHEQVIVNGGIGKLNNLLIHYNYQSIGQFNVKQEHYAKLEAKRVFEDGRRFSLSYLFGKPLKEFYFRYLKNYGFLDGWRGLVLSVLMAGFRVKVALKIRRMGQR